MAYILYFLIKHLAFNKWKTLQQIWKNMPSLKHEALENFPGRVWSLSYFSTKTDKLLQIPTNSFSLTLFDHKQTGMCCNPQTLFPAAAVPGTGTLSPVTRSLDPHRQKMKMRSHTWICVQAHCQPWPLSHCQTW